MKPKNKIPKKLMETESLVVYKGSKKNKKKADVDGIKVKYKELEFTLNDFEKVEINGELEFAFKIKKDRQMILYYIPDSIHGLKRMEIIEYLEEFSKKIDFELMDILKAMQNVYSQKHIFDKMGGEK